VQVIQTKTMSNDKTQQHIDDALHSIQQIAQTAGYREKVECLEVIDKMSWFDNFGENQYRHRINTAQKIADDGNDEDIPEHLADHF